MIRFDIVPSYINSSEAPLPLKVNLQEILCFFNLFWDPRVNSYFWKTLLNIQYNFWTVSSRPGLTTPSQGCTPSCKDMTDPRADELVVAAKLEAEYCPLEDNSSSPQSSTHQRRSLSGSLHSCVRRVGVDITSVVEVSGEGLVQIFRQTLDIEDVL